MLGNGVDPSPYDRVILDLRVPSFNGYNVLRWIREHESTRLLWIGLPLPNSDRGVWKQICYRADAYLVKMPNPIELVL